MTRPLIQIDDEVREMTEDEHANYLLIQASGQLSPTEPEESTQIGTELPQNDEPLIQNGP